MSYMMNMDIEYL